MTDTNEGKRRGELWRGTTTPRAPLAPPTDRRTFLKLAGWSALAGGAAACTPRSPEELVPYVDMPEHVVPGRPTYYATTLLREGYGYGAIVETREGRPIKIDGNPGHPATLGASDAVLQAELMQLYDPDRSRTPLHDGTPRSLDALAADLATLRERLLKSGGRGLRVLTPPVTSPTQAARLGALLDSFPEARWHQWHALARDAAITGSRIAFGRAVDITTRMDRADVIVQLDGDFLAEGPAHLAHAADFSSRRRPGPGMLRLWVMESTPGLAGAAADHTLVVPQPRVVRLALALAAELGLAVPAAEGLSPRERRWVAACARDLAEHRGRALVLAGDPQPPAVHALAHWLNAALDAPGRTLEWRDPALARPEPVIESLTALAEDMHRGEVDALVVIDGDPAYDAPADLRFAEGLERVSTVIHHGLYVDATARRADWHVPLAHDLESWGDARAFDGSVSLQQPLVEPLHASLPRLALPEMLMGRWPRSDREVVAAHWEARLGGESAEPWKAALRAGIVAGTASSSVDVVPRPSAIRDALAETPGNADAPAPVLQFRADPHVSDGRYASNAWLQELPRPLTKLTWDNALLISPAMAERMGIGDEEVLRVSTGQATIEAPAWVLPGMPDEALTIWLGHGRAIRSGGEGDSMADGVGVDAYPLRTTGALFARTGIDVEPVGRRYALAATQHHHRMEGREPVRRMTLAEFLDGRDHAPQGDEHPSLYPEPVPAPFDVDAPQWGMAVDLNACTGCMACTAACQAENNIPVVGKRQVRAGREMHWIRVDRYYEGDADAPRTLFQPVPCQHCENAPCEYVCPTGATQHDSEGLNVMVYNRCIGTRDCSQNCPYKVRRFNFVEYNYGAQEAELLSALRNPDVTVRSRGVMEKCTYCIQRISRARRQAKIEDRPIADGDVVTACQQACPTGAIVFGDVSDPESAVSRAKNHPLDYALLAELNTRPRTTYRARVRNPHPDLEENDSSGGDKAHG